MSWNPTDGCKTHDINLHNDMIIHNPLLILSSGLGIIIGLVGIYLTRKYVSYRTEHNSPFISSPYTLIYMSFACMNFAGMIVWCFSDLSESHKDKDHKVSNSARLWLMIDGIFSSLISFNFIIAWMSDVDLFSLNRICNKITMFIFYILIAIGYFAETYLGWKQGWNLLYIQLTQFASVSYFLAQLYLMIKTKNFNGITLMIFAGAVGMFGLFMFHNGKAQKFYCNVSLGWFDGMCVWYTESDISLALLLAFAIKRYGKEPNQDYAGKQNQMKILDNDLKTPLV